MGKVTTYYGCDEDEQSEDSENFLEVRGDGESPLITDDIKRKIEALETQKMKVINKGWAAHEE